MTSKSEKRTYEKPSFEVVEFLAEDSIASSGVSFYEEIWGNFQ